MGSLLGPTRRTSYADVIVVARNGSTLVIEASDASGHAVRFEGTCDDGPAVGEAFPYGVLYRTHGRHRNLVLERIASSTWIAEGRTRSIATTAPATPRPTQEATGNPATVPTAGLVRAFREVAAFDRQGHVQLSFGDDLVEVTNSTGRHLVCRSVGYADRGDGIPGDVVLTRCTVDLVRALDGHATTTVRTGGGRTTFACGRTTVSGPTSEREARPWRPTVPEDFPYHVDVARKNLEDALAPGRSAGTDAAIHRDGDVVVVDGTDVPCPGSSDLFDEVLVPRKMLRAAVACTRHDVLRIRTSHTHPCVLVGSTDVDPRRGDLAVVVSTQTE